MLGNSCIEIAELFTVAETQQIRPSVNVDRKYLTPIEVECLVDAAGAGPNGVRDRAMCLVMFYHAMRASELIGLTVDDLLLDDARINVRRIKNGLTTVQPLNKVTLKALRRWLAIRPDKGFREVFISRQSEPYTRQGINRLFDYWGRRAAIPFRIHPHMLRHACGYALVNRPNGTRDLRAIQDWMGHRDIKHTAQYTALAPDRFKGLWGV